MKADLIFFLPKERAGLPPLGVVLDTADDLRVFSGWFAASSPTVAEKLTTALNGRTLRESVLVAISYSPGCNEVGTVTLAKRGSDLILQPVNVIRHNECIAPWELLAVFAVDRSAIPDQATIGGKKPDRPGPSLLLGLHAVGEQVSPLRAAEVSQPDQLDQFVAQMPAAVGHIVRDSVEHGREASTRLFALLTRACLATTAILIVEQARMSAVAVEARDGPLCAAPHPYIAIFTINAEFVPPRARLDPGP